ncbi:MAG: hypothetical protein Q4C12_05795 [Clostridia bacterium]|nr:hypothetical protein [Clostridia bacterium]
MSIKTTFEAELRKILGNNEIMENTTYVGRACYGSLCKDIRARIEFTTSGIADDYDALQITILNRKEGKIDVNRIRFLELWGIKKIQDNPYFKDGVCPKIWKSGNDIGWYAYQPTPRDIEMLRDAAANYLDVFREQTMEESQEIQMM